MAQDRHEAFERDFFTIRRQFFRIFGGAFHLYDDEGQPVLYSNMKRFRLREDIRLYADDSMDRELLRITTRSVFDFSGAYDVVDAESGERLGSLRRSGLRSSFLRDHWTVLDRDGEPVGEIQEDSTLKALLRRYLEVLAIFMPQRYHLELGGKPAGWFQQRFNPLILKMDLDFSGDPERRLDRRLGVAAGVLICAIEGRQD